MTGRLRAIAIDTKPLRHPDYRRLFIGQGVSFVGFQVTAVAVPVQVYAISLSSFWVGVLGLVGLVPLIVFGLWGGAVADAVDRRKLLLVSAAVTWVVTLALLVQALQMAHDVSEALDARGADVEPPPRAAWRRA